MSPHTQLRARQHQSIPSLTPLYLSWYLVHRIQKKNLIEIPTVYLNVE